MGKSDVPGAKRWRLAAICSFLAATSGVSLLIGVVRLSEFGPGRLVATCVIALMAMGVLLGGSTWFVCRRKSWLRDEASFGVKAAIVNLCAIAAVWSFLASSGVGHFKARERTHRNVSPPAPVEEPAPTEPVVQGRTLNQWSADLLSDDAETRHSAAERVATFTYSVDQIVAILTKHLGDRNSAERIRAARGLAELETEAASAVASLQKATRDTNPLVRRASLGALLAIDPTAIDDWNELSADDLIAFLEEPAHPARRRAVFCLGLRASDPEVAVPSLVAALADESPKLKRAALFALACYGDRSAEAAPAIVEANEKNDNDPILSVAADWALVRLNKSDGQALAERLVANYSAMPAEHSISSTPPDTRTVDGLIAALKSNDRQVRIDAALALTRRGTESAPAASALHVAAVGDDEELSYRALAALRSFDREAVIRAVAARARISLQPDPLRSGPDNVGDDMSWHSLAAERLGGSGQELIEALVGILKAEHESRVSEACTALAYIGPDAANTLPELQRRLERGAVLRPVIRVLEKIGPAAEDASEKLVELLSTRDGDAALDALIAIGTDDPKVIAKLHEEFAKSLSSDRMQVACALALLSNWPPAADRIAEDFSEHPRLAFEMLTRIGRTEAAPTDDLTELLENRLAPDDMEFGVHGLVVLGFRGKRALPAQRQAIERAFDPIYGIRNDDLHSERLSALLTDSPAEAGRFSPTSFEIRTIVELGGNSNWHHRKRKQILDSLWQNSFEPRMVLFLDEIMSGEPPAPNEKSLALSLLGEWIVHALPEFASDLSHHCRGESTTAAAFAKAEEASTFRPAKLLLETASLGADGALAVAVADDWWRATGDPRAIDTLAKLVEHGDPALREAAVVSLGEAGAAAESAAPRIILALYDPHPKVRRAAIVALKRVAPAFAGEGVD